MVENKTLSIWGDGESVRDYLFIDDFIELLCLLLKNNDEGLLGRAQVYNVGSSIGYSLKELINLVEKVTALTVRCEYRPARKIDVRRIVLNCDKIHKDIGWSAKTSLAEGLRVLWEIAKQG